MDAVTQKLKKLQKLTKNKKNEYIVKVNQQLESRFNSTVIRSNIFAISQRVGLSGPIRYLNQLPPEYLDKPKDFNAYGDLIIGEKIIGFAKQTQTKKVVFLTNDLKVDWMYSPSILRIDGLERPNTDSKIKIVDPRLVFEFNLATASDEIYIIDMEILTKLLIEDGNTDYYELAKALQLV